MKLFRIAACAMTLTCNGPAVASVELPPQRIAPAATQPLNANTSDSKGKRETTSTCQMSFRIEIDRPGQRAIILPLGVQKCG